MTPAGVVLRVVYSVSDGSVVYGYLGIEWWRCKMPVLTASAAHQLDIEASSRSIREIAAYLQDTVGQRVAAAIAGLADAKQIGRYAREDGPQPHGTAERRLRE